MLCSRTITTFSLTAIALALFWPAASTHADLFDDRDELLLANDPAPPQVHTPAFGNPLEDHTAQDNADPPEDDPDTNGPKKSKRPRFEFDRSGGEDPFAIITRSSTDWMMPDGHPISVFDNAAAPVTLNDTADVQPAVHDPGAPLLLLTQTHYGAGAFGDADPGASTIVPSASSGIPTPGALVLIGVGGLLSRRRRRRHSC